MYMCSGAGKGTRTPDPLLGKDRVAPKRGSFFIQYFKPYLDVFQRALDRSPSRTVAYRIQGYTASLGASGVPVPNDEVAAVKFMKLGLRAQELETNLQ